MTKRMVLKNQFLASVADMLSEGKKVRIRIDGESMYPFIRGGKDEVELIPYTVSRPLQLGECIFYEWKGQFMIHRYIGRKEDKYLMMGDGNLVQIEEVSPHAIKGILGTIFKANGKIQDCSDEKWIKKGLLWYRMRKLRRFILPILKRIR